MRIVPAVLLSLPALLAACANPSAPATAEAPLAAMNCEQATVPADAVIGVRGGLTIATYPAKVTRGMTGCQRVWYGDPAHRERMEVLATYYFQDGQVHRLVGRVPGGPSYDCHYHEGTLDTASSLNPAQCPKSTTFDGP